MPKHPSKTNTQVCLQQNAALFRVRSGYGELFEGVSVTTLVVAPGVRDGVRAAGLATTSVSPGAPVTTSSKNVDLASICVTVPVMFRASAGVGQGRGAPVHARAPQNQLSSETHI